MFNWSGRVDGPKSVLSRKHIGNFERTRRNKLSCSSFHVASVDSSICPSICPSICSFERTQRNKSSCSHFVSVRCSICPAHCNIISIDWRCVFFRKMKILHILVPDFRRRWLEWTSGSARGIANWLRFWWILGKMTKNYLRQYNWPNSTVNRSCKNCE